MWGPVGTFLVLAIQTMLALGIDTQTILLIAIVSSAVWAIHAISMRDKWLLGTNVALGAIAVVGIM